MNATFAPRAFPAGRIGFSSQSGALGLALLERAESRGLGLSAFVSIGNKADVSSNDLLEWWEDDKGTDLVLLYLESFGNPRKFARIARRLAREKPVLAMKSGRSGAGRKAAGSHTAALAGSDTAVDAVFRQAGVIRADTLSGLLDVAALLSCQPVPRGRRVAVLTNAGGLGILCADACEAAGLELPCSPRRRAQPSPRRSHGGVGRKPGGHARLGDGRELPVGAAAPPRRPRDRRGHRALRPGCLASRLKGSGAAISMAVAEADQPDKPVLASILAAAGPPATLRSAAHVPAFSYPEAAAAALGRAVEYGEWLRHSAGSVVHLDDVDAAAAAEVIVTALAHQDEAWLDPAATRRLLAAYRIPLVPSSSPTRRRRQQQQPPTLGFPAVVKTAAAGAHKTESGGVALDLSDAEAVRSAAKRIGCPVIVQPMIKGGVELLAGVAQDPVFGPLVAFGPGGVLAELIGDAHFRLTPLTDVDADELVGAGKAGRLVGGLPRCSARRRGGARRRAAPALAARRRLPRARGARSQPRARPSSRGRRGRRPHPPRPAAASHRRQELVAIDEIAFVPEQVRQLRDKGLPVVALGSIVAGAVLWLAGSESGADLAWAAGAVVVLVPLVVSTARSLLRRDVGVDAIALVAIVWALALDQYLAAAIVALMMSGGAALEAWAAGRARRELRLLVERAPRVAHRYASGSVEEVSVEELRPGDVVVIRAGEVVPADGVVVGARGRPRRVRAHRRGAAAQGWAVRPRALGDCERGGHVRPSRDLAGGGERLRGDRSSRRGRGGGSRRFHANGRPLRGLLPAVLTRGRRARLAGIGRLDTGARGHGRGDAVPADPGRPDRLRGRPLAGGQGRGHRQGGGRSGAARRGPNRAARQDGHAHPRPT